MEEGGEREEEEIHVGEGGIMKRKGRRAIWIRDGGG